MVDNQPFVEVIKIYADVRKLQIRENKEHADNNSSKVIRRRAGDDWF